MKKQKTNYRFFRYDGKVLLARKEIPFEMKLAARLILDELCYSWNKKHIQERLDQALLDGDEKEFANLSKEFQQFIME